VTEGSQEANSTGEGQDATGQPVANQPQTVEEAEAIWKNRMSGKDRAHAAETAALKAQMEALIKNQPPAQGESPEAARVKELEAALAAEKAARLQTKYPLAAGVLGDAMTSLPEEKLAAIEAGFDSGAPAVNPIIDPNAAARRGTGVPGTAAKPLNEKSKDELLGDLRKLAPAYQQAAREGLI
jgi:hypothetical protein